MDWIDTSIEQQQAMADALLRQRRAGGPAPRQDGLCCNGCGEPALPGAAFCSAECRDDWQHREGRNG